MFVSSRKFQINRAITPGESRLLKAKEPNLLCKPHTTASFENQPFLSTILGNSCRLFRRAIQWPWSEILPSLWVKKPCPIWTMTGKFWSLPWNDKKTWTCSARMQKCFLPGIYQSNPTYCFCFTASCCFPCDREGKRSPAKELWAQGLAWLLSCLPLLLGFLSHCFLVFLV